MRVQAAFLRSPCGASGPRQWLSPEDYATQTRLLKQGIEKRIDAEVTVEFNPSKSTDTRFEIYKSDDWAEGYDVVLHDECCASVIERPCIDRILKAHHDGVPAVTRNC